jgi:Uma2 family endonuclease
MNALPALKPASLPASAHLSLYEQLCALPENQTGEILNGQLHSQPRPSARHGLAKRALNIDLGGPYDFGRNGPGGWWIIPEPEVHFVRDTEVAVPDLAGWRRERMPQVPNDHRFEVVPDWVCEILSPSTARKDRIVKLPFYARQGVAYAWLVDPEARTLEAYELRQNHWMLIAALQDEAPVRVAPFNAIEFSLGDLWG